MKTKLTKKQFLSSLFGGVLGYFGISKTKGDEKRTLIEPKKTEPGMLAGVFCLTWECSKHGLSPTMNFSTRTQETTVCMECLSELLQRSDIAHKITKR